MDSGLDDEHYATWNEELLSQARSFAESTALASVHLVSSYNIISEFLDRPEEFGLEDCVEGLNSDSERTNSNGDDDKIPLAMWEDDIHLSKAAHQAFADRIWETLRE